MATKTPIDHSNIDRQIAEILTCKPLPEAEIKALCEKVTTTALRPKKS
jgi:hypothetical protein